jgi:cardiolipin synthase
MNAAAGAAYEWLETGAEALAWMLAAIAGARQSIRLEMYMVRADAAGEQFLQALIEARRRGVRAQVLVDAVGSLGLPDSFWAPFRAAGGEFRWFNPVSLNRLSIRDHRKLLVCDQSPAFVGGVNIASEYLGDGVKVGWRDLGLVVRGPLAAELAAAFEEMFVGAAFRHPVFARLRASSRQKTVAAPEARLLLGGPGRNNPIKLWLRRDIERAQRVWIICSYFLPPWRIRRELARAARRGAQTRLILPGKSDVALSLLAGQSFYRRLLRAGVEIYEYQPQILHAKLFLIDGIVYAGSANLDTRGMNINYELLVRLSDPALARRGAEIFQRDLALCRRIELASWRKARTLLDRIKARLARFILARVDPYVARRQWKQAGEND